MFLTTYTYMRVATYMYMIPFYNAIIRALHDQ